MTEPCCQEHHDHLARAEAHLATMIAARQPPATASDADHLDAMKAVRIAHEAIAKHVRWHVRDNRRQLKQRREAAAGVRVQALEAKLNSYALADALASFSADVEDPPLIDDAHRISPEVIVGCVYDAFADSGHWPTMDTAAALVAHEMGATFDAARQAVGERVQGAYTAAQTCVLVRHGEAVSEGADDVWRLMVHDHDVPRLAALRECAEWYDAAVAGWQKQLAETLDS